MKPRSNGIAAGSRAGHRRLQHPPGSRRGSKELQRGGFDKGQERGSADERQGNISLDPEINRGVTLVDSAECSHDRGGRLGDHRAARVRHRRHDTGWLASVTWWRGPSGLLMARPRRRWTHLGIVLGILYVIAGVYLLAHPVAGLASLTFALAAFLFIGAIIEIILSTHLRLSSGSGWLLVDGIITVVLAIMMWWTWPKQPLAARHTCGHQHDLQRDCPIGNLPGRAPCCRRWGPRPRSVGARLSTASNMTPNSIGARQCERGQQRRGSENAHAAKDLAIKHVHSERYPWSRHVARDHHRQDAALG